jgi:AraC-like DNA-binding protein
MGAVSDKCASLQFSTSDIDDRDRLSFWRDFFCRQVVQVEIEPKSDLPLGVEVSLISCPGLQAMWAQTSIPVRLSRTAEMIADGTDSVAIVINRSGCASITQGHEATLDISDAIGLLHAEPAAMVRSEGAWMALMIPRTALMPAVAKIEAATMQLVPNGNEAIALLVSYMNSLKGRLETMSPELRSLAVAHVHDLIAMAFGTTNAGAVAALSGGVRAARLHAIKADVLSNLGNHDLTLANVAKRQRVTPRYIHMIFELEGISFSEYVLEQRLLRALHLMTDRRFADWKVTALASEAGFGDLSYFNRTFRRRFGMTPSEARKLHAERAWAHSPADELTGKGEIL